MGKACLGSRATAGLCQPLIGMMPPHDVYIETHLGGGAIMKRKPPALHSIGIERDARALGDFTCAYPVELVHGCCHAFLEGYPFEGRELVYADPPYLKSTRKAPERYRYRYDYGEADHVALIGILRSLPCRVMLSGYPSRLYDRLLPDWRCLEVQVMNRAGVVTEAVWYNFEIDRLHWSRHAGDSPNQRQDVKRKAERWARSWRWRPNSGRGGRGEEPVRAEGRVRGPRGRGPVSGRDGTAVPVATGTVRDGADAAGREEHREDAGEFGPAGCRVGEGRDRQAEGPARRAAARAAA